MKINKKSKFYTPKPLKERAIDFFKSLLFWKGRKKGIIHTGDITWNDIRAIFFPKDFHEKYRYLGSVPWNEKGDMFKAMEPLVIYMDYKAKPWWCPRWVLRFLHLFGNDNSIVRVRNRFWANLSNKLTKGYVIWDYKTKWNWYDLRISVAGNNQMHFLADAIESKFYNDGIREDMFLKIKTIDPNTKFTPEHSRHSLKEELERLEDLQERNKIKTNENY
jgi:hypothetical protein